MRLLPLAFGIAGIIVGAASGQTILLDNFDAGSATGSVLAGTSWVGSVTQNDTSITVGNNATDVNGWAKTGLSLNATGSNFLTVTAQRNSGNAATTFAVQFEDATINPYVVSVNVSACLLYTSDAADE